MPKGHPVRDATIEFCQNYFDEGHEYIFAEDYADRVGLSRKAAYERLRELSQHGFLAQGDYEGKVAFFMPGVKSDRKNGEKKEPHPITKEEIANAMSTIRVGTAIRYKVKEEEKYKTINAKVTGVWPRFIRLDTGHCMGWPDVAKYLREKGTLK